eukprot:11201721-Lingulodinium_polyedra.AAC.1
MCVFGRGGVPREALKRHLDIIERSPEAWDSSCDKVRAVPIYDDPISARRPQVMTDFAVQL